MLKIGIVGLLALAGAYFAGAFGGVGYSRDVGRPQAEVMAALEHLDITTQPGSPGTDPAASGGVLPLFRLEKTENSMSWYVMSGDKVATKMTALFVPFDDGKQTRVTAEVERGDAPDDFVSPAFRSRGITMGLFGLAVDGELNRLTAPPAADPAKCQEIMQNLANGNLAARRNRPDGLNQVIGETAQTVIVLHAIDAEMRRIGCPTESRGDQFTPVESHMMAGPRSSGPSASEERNADGVSFKPGTPMIDTRPKK